MAISTVTKNGAAVIEEVPKPTAEHAYVTAEAQPLPRDLWIGERRSLLRRIFIDHIAVNLPRRHWVACSKKLMAKDLEVEFGHRATIML